MRLCLAALLFVAACGTTSPPPKEAEPPPATYEEEVSRAAKAVSELEKIVRYNPVNCSCPAFEVLLGQRWVRVQVDGADDPTSVAGVFRARAKRDLANDKLERYSVVGDLSASGDYCAQGALYLSLSVDAVR